MTRSDLQPLAGKNATQSFSTSLYRVRCIKSSYLLSQSESVKSDDIDVKTILPEMLCFLQTNMYSLEKNVSLSFFMSALPFATLSRIKFPFRFSLPEMRGLGKMPETEPPSKGEESILFRPSEERYHPQGELPRHLSAFLAKLDCKQNGS